MKIKICLAAILLFLCSTQIVFAQDKSQKEQKKVLVCSDCGFPINGKPISLPKPEYPKAASMVRTSGAVQVQITIDETGNVESAKTVSGHPLLWAESVKSALKSKWKPITLSGKPVKVTGVIVYNFCLDEPILPTQPDKPKQKVIVDLGGGTVIGKPIKLSKPIFPRGCSCKFSRNLKTIVQFTVNEKGNVESAFGIAGHPLLKAASVAAIRNSKFYVSRVDGAPAKVFGLIIYDYVLSRNKLKSRIVKYELEVNKSELQK